MRYASLYLDRFPKPKTNEDENLMKIANQMVKHPLFPKSKSAMSVYNELKSGSDQRFIGEYPYLSTKDGCTVTILENIGESFPLIAGDHAFQGKTYQKALDDDITNLNDIYGICNVQ